MGFHEFYIVTKIMFVEGPIEDRFDLLSFVVNKAIIVIMVVIVVVVFIN